MSRLTPFGFLFGKSLTDLVRGIRRYADEDQRAEYLRGVVSECREEVRSADIDVKSQAVLKLAYLEMLGIDMSWAGFHVIEVMASPNFQQKRVGYMAASQCFKTDNELKMLVTNLLKMDLVNQNSATVGVALSGLAAIVSPGLAADISDDIMRMLSHSQPYIRKKAVLAMYNIITQYPEALPQAIKRFGDLLEDSQNDLSDSGNVSVACATVSVICELSAHAESIQDFLELTPRLYSLFTSSEHNWTLIKLLKIFQLFTVREPRLKSRLLPAVRNMMIETNASALAYECMKCIIQGRMVDEDDFELAKELVDSLGTLMESGDTNLKYLASGLFCDLASINPQFLPEKGVLDLIKTMQPDPATRKKVLQLAHCVVSDDNLFDLIQDLLLQFKSTDNLGYKEDVAHAICHIGAANNYEYIPDFEWYIGVLGEVTDSIADKVISKRILDIVLRVKDNEVRNSVSTLCLRWLQKGASQSVGPEQCVDFKNTHSDREKALSHFRDICWWIVGEYNNPAIIADPSQLVNSIQLLPAGNPIVITSLVKVTSRFSVACSSRGEVEALLDAVISVLTGMSYSLDYEVQERACQFLEFLKLAKSSPVQRDALLQDGLASLFESSELGPIAPGSQKRLTVPESLDLHTPIEVASTSSLIASLDDDISSDGDDDDDYTPESHSTYSDDILGAGSSNKEDVKHEVERRLYNLHELSKLNISGSKLEGINTAKRPSKKKVMIASDETVEAPVPMSTVPKGVPSITGVNHTKNINNHTGGKNDLPPVKVKHKKKKKQKHSELKPDEDL